MNTAVQVRPPSGDAHPRAELVSGTPSAVISTARGPVALFGSGEIVAYLLRFRRRPRLFVFRTLTVDDRLAASIPGVRPRVQLLLQLRTPVRIGRARDLFAYLARTERDPSALADDFYVRVGAVLAGSLRLTRSCSRFYPLPQPRAPHGRSSRRSHVQRPSRRGDREVIGHRLKSTGKSERPLDNFTQQIPQIPISRRLVGGAPRAGFPNRLCTDRDRLAIAWEQFT